MLQTYSLTATNPRKDGNPNTLFSTKAQISIPQEGETSAMANALLERADGRVGLQQQAKCRSYQHTFGNFRINCD